MMRPFSWLSQLSGAVVRRWYQPTLSPLLAPLLPLSALVAWEARRRLRKFHQQPPTLPAIPVIVVGNVTVGGTGKTPLVAELVKRLQGQGFSPGIISRGYGAAGDTSRRVDQHSDPALCGDEPVMLAALTGVPVVVDSNRQRALECLLATTPCDIVISDDGLQHFRLARHIELAVIDGQRLLGNGRCLPAGPLREPMERLHTVDFIVYNGAPSQMLPLDRHQAVMTLTPSALRPVAESEHPTGSVPVAGDTVHGVAGIGNPARFFDSLGAQGFTVIDHAFPDHHPFLPDDLSFPEKGAVIMTAKDAVKCRAFAQPDWWYVPVQATLPETFWDALWDRLQLTSRSQG